MGLIWSRRKRIAPGTNVNLSKSGASVSKKAGPLTVNSKGRASVKLGKGLRFKI